MNPAAKRGTTDGAILANFKPLVATSNSARPTTNLQYKKRFPTSARNLFFISVAAGQSRGKRGL
jgi:hypothetical protein